MIIFLPRSRTAAGELAVAANWRQVGCSACPRLSTTPTPYNRQLLNLVFEDWRDAT